MAILAQEESIKTTHYWFAYQNWGGGARLLKKYHVSIARYRENCL
jgi:hypothetical protein